MLGDRIGISWYKDVRKARAYGKTVIEEGLVIVFVRQALTLRLGEFYYRIQIFY